MVRSSDVTIPLFDYNIDFKSRTLYYGSSATGISGTETQGVNDFSSEQLIKGLKLLNDISNKQITIIWSSDGGEWDAGIAAYEFIRTIKSPVKLVSYSRCRSMGSIILQACAIRVLSKNSRFMLHYGTAGVEAIHSKDFERFTDELKVSNRLMEQIYLKKIRMKHPRYTLARLRQLMTYDCYMSAQAAVDLGLADKVI